jgi:hypothetical protein
MDENKRYKQEDLLNLSSLLEDENSPDDDGADDV